MMRRTKIICTLGPASSDAATVAALIDAGMNVARLNFSHGTHEQHRRLFDLVRRLAAEHGQPVAVLQDLQGPKIRVGQLAGGRLALEVGTRVTIRAGTNSAGKGEIPCTYEGLASDVGVGDQILLDDGRLELRVLDAAADRVDCEVVTGGTLTDHKGINLPGVALSTPALTEKDRADLALGLELGVDFVALSFVRSADDCLEARRLAPEIPLVAKIEKPQAVEAVGEILEATEGIMIARGDLGVEIGADEVPLVQKTLIELANRRGQLVITATEMLDSMRHSPRPTRAEVSDVANAILDGTDAVMLSGETAAGHYPLQAVRMMDRIIRQTEASARFLSLPEPPSLDYPEATHAVAHAAVVAAREIEAQTIICYTETGKSAILISEYRPAARVLAVTCNRALYQRLAMQWGVTPLLLDACPTTTEETIAAMVAIARRSGHARSGEEAIITLGTRTDGVSDLMKVHRL